MFKAFFGWGVVLWLIGYLLGIVLFPFVPNFLLGWVIMPIGMVVTIAVLLKKINFTKFSDYFLLANIWVVLSMVLDYFLLVKLLNPKDGYYKLDVYVYYLLTFTLPLVVYWYKTKKRR